MARYIPHYSEKTSIPKGTSPSREEILARESLLHEVTTHTDINGWTPATGHTVIYHTKEPLCPETQNLLCLQEIP